MSRLTTQNAQGTGYDAVRGNAICVLAIVTFAAGFPVAEELLQSWGAISLITARVILSCGVLFPLWVMFDGWHGVARAPWRRGLGIGALGFGTGTVLFIVGQDITDPVTAVLVAASMPVTAVALEVLLDGRRLTRNFVMGAGLVLIGGYLATGASLRDGNYGGGVLLGLLATMLFAWGSRQSVKGLPGMSTFGQCTLTLIGAMIFCVGTYVLFIGFGWQGAHHAPLTREGWVLLLFYAWGTMAFSQLMWLVGVSRLGIGLASFHLNAAPFYVMLILLAMGGAWDWQKAAGAAALCLGVVLAQRRTVPRSEGTGKM